jgi:hypothetical protein
VVQRKCRVDETFAHSHLYATGVGDLMTCALRPDSPCLVFATETFRQSHDASTPFHSAGQASQERSKKNNPASTQRRSIWHAFS